MAIPMRIAALTASLSAPSPPADIMSLADVDHTLRAIRDILA